MLNIRDFIDETALNEIRQELKKYSAKDIEKFEELCPVEKYFDVFVIDVYPRYNSLYGCDNTVCLKKDDPYLDFWRRWNRFWKLKAFW